MSYEYRITKHNDSILTEMGKDSWQLITIVDKKMYWSRTIKQTRNIKKEDEFPEWLEFIKHYREINNKGSYSETLINKYKTTLKEISHKDMMNKLKEYEEHLKAYNKPPLQIGTFLNQKRYKDTYETVKVDYVNKWRDDILKERGIKGHIAEVIIQEANAWDSKNGQNKEMTTNIFNNIISKYDNKL